MPGIVIIAAGFDQGCVRVKIFYLQCVRNIVMVLQELIEIFLKLYVIKVTFSFSV